LLLLLVLGTERSAFALDPRDVPEPLKPWLPWVLPNQADLCAQLAGQPACVWPGRLALQLVASGGSFRLSVQVDGRANVALPGGDKQWPRDVQVDARPAVVLGQAGVPTLALESGSHEITGRFSWPELPETLALPEQVALLSLTLLGQVVPAPKRDAGRVWLQGKQALVDEPESLTLEVFRKLEDQVPFRVHTQLVLQVSGRSRELALGNVLLDGAIPIELVSKLPARLEQSGQLLLQVYPGRHQIELHALYPTPPSRLAAARHAPPWPNHEIWVFVPATEYRQTQVFGGLGIDPQRTNLPAAWQGSAAYQMEAGAELVLSTLRRGQPNPAPNRLSLQRELWLALDGQSYTVKDRITGASHRTWRLDLNHGELGHVAVAGIDQLITLHPGSGVRGVEVRQTQLDLSAEWRLPHAAGPLPAVAWSENVEQLASELYLPPGWQLLWASGVDHVSDSWLSRWDLFAVFFVLVIAIAIAKLDRPVWGVLGLCALFLSHGEAQAPQFIWGAVLISIALLRGLPAGRFRSLIRALAFGSGLLLLGLTASFGVSQIRSALYPQADGGGGMFELRGSGDQDSSPGAERGSLAAGDLVQQMKSAPSEASESAAAPSPKAAREAYVSERRKSAELEQDPGALIQTGPGVPGWRWKQWHLGWSGPVEQGHTLELHLVSPGVQRVLSALRILLVGLLTYWALRLLFASARRPARGAPAAGASTAVSLVAVLLLGLLSAAPARADLPSPELLEQLRQRVQPAACVGECLEVPWLELRVAGNALRAVAEVHAGSRVAYQLPGPAARWVPARVEVDEREATALLLGADGYLYLRLAPGRHRVALEGDIAGRELTLEPGTPPRAVQVDAPGWDVSGLSEHGQLNGSLHLVRPLPMVTGLDAPPDGASDRAASALASWSLVTRTFQLGVSWSVESELRRVGPPGELATVKVPLLPGERVTDTNVAVEGAFAVVRLLGDAESVRWGSVLEPRSKLSLSAPAQALYNERWVVRCGPIYHCDLHGIAPIQHEQGGRWEPTFAPWPGEELAIEAQRPAAAEGETATLDSVTLELHPGVRLLRAELHATVRASAQTAYLLKLPEGSEVDQLSIDGRDEPIRQGGATLELVFAPGRHELRVSWQEPGGLTTWFSAPHVSLGKPLSNARVNVHLPGERWLLYAGGPAWGPAILFWGHLVLILLLAPVLARLPRSPLQSWEWALLSLGLTQVPLPIAGLVFGWFFVIAWHDVDRPARPLWFNLRQFGLLMLTLIFLGCLFGAVYDSLLNTPDMEVVGAGSSNQMLGWYVDRTDGELPRPWVVSTSLWVWRGVMLLWALWLAWNLVGWLKWAWLEISEAGVWKPWSKARNS
jgi:hypothetical protein